MTVSVDTGLKYQNEAPVRTTDATSTELLRWTPELDSASVVLLSVNGTATSGDRLASQRLYKVQRSSSGTVVTAMAAEQRHESGSAAWPVALAVDGGDGVSAVVTVAGEAGHDVTWQGLADHKGRGRNIIPPLTHGQCLEFNNGATDEYVDLGAELSFERTDAFSVSVWFKTSSATTQAFVAKMSDDTGWSVGITSAGLLTLTLYHDWDPVASDGITVDSSGHASVIDGAWHHACYSYDGSSTAAGVDMWLDGSPVGTSASLDALTDSIVTATDAAIGRRQNSSPKRMIGRLDEIAVYSAVLSNADVTWLHTPRDPRSSGAPADLEHYWPMGDHDDGATVRDWEGSADGTTVAMDTSNIIADAP